MWGSCLQAGISLFSWGFVSLTCVLKPDPLSSVPCHSRAVCLCLLPAPGTVSCNNVFGFCDFEKEISLFPPTVLRLEWQAEHWEGMGLAIGQNCILQNPNFSLIKIAFKIVYNKMSKCDCLAVLLRPSFSVPRQTAIDTLSKCMCGIREDFCSNFVNHSHMSSKPLVSCL